MELNRFQNILQRQNIIPEGFVNTLPLFAAQNQAREQVQLLKANLEQQLLKEQILKLLALKNELMHQTMNKIILKSQLQPNSPPCLLGELPSLVPQFSHSPVNSENSFRQNLSPIPKTKTDKLVKKNKETQKETLVGIKLESSSETTSNLKMRAQLRAILSFLVANFGKKSEDSIESERKKYQSDKQMLEVFDILVRKYSGASKSREEMIKYILRKALRAVKNTIQKKMEIDSKEASSFLCKRYFNPENEGLNEKEAVQEQKEIEDEEEDLLKASLPFRKNSKNKTMNANFLTEIFSSDQFCKDYELYLSQIDEILSKDNEKKIDAFLTFLENCVKKNQVSTIKSCKRMPWLQVWLESTKNLAFELSTTKSWVENRKKVNLGLE